MFASLVAININLDADNEGLETIFGFLSILCFQKSNVFVGCGSADVEDPCQLRHIRLLCASGKAGYFQHNDGISFLGCHKKSRFPQIGKRDNYLIIYLSIPQAKAASIKARSFITAS